MKSISEICITVRRFSLVCFFLPVVSTVARSTFYSCIVRRRADDIVAAQRPMMPALQCSICGLQNTACIATLANSARCVHPLSYWQNYSNKVTLTMIEGNGQIHTPTSHAPAVIGTLDRSWGSLKTVPVMVIGAKSLSMSIIKDRQNSIWPTNTACFHST